MRNQWLSTCCPHCDLEQALQEGAEPPCCAVCSNLVRPGVVWFGEHLPAEALAQAEAAANTCEVMLVVGTSGVVYPAAGLVFQAYERGARIVMVNTEVTELDMLAHALLRGSAAQLLPQLLR